MREGGRNRLIVWTGFAIPYRPEKTDLIETTRRVQRVLDDGWVDRDHGGGADPPRRTRAAAAGRRPCVLRPAGRRPDRPDRDQRHQLARRPAARPGPGGRARSRPRAARRARRSTPSPQTTRDALLRLVADFPDPPPPGRFGRWLTELFNDWPEGARPALGAGDAAGPSSRRDRTRADGRVWHPAGDVRSAGGSRGRHRPVHRRERVPLPARGPGGRPDRRVGVRSSCATS